MTRDRDAIWEDVKRGLREIEDHPSWRELRDAVHELWELLDALDDYDWSEVYGYASGHNRQHQAPRIESCDTAAVTPFGRADVYVEWGRVAGENDGEDWLAWGQLKDKRWYVIQAGCDYTGWDCNASGWVWVASDRATLIRAGMGDEQRFRLGLTIPAEVTDG